MKRYFPLALILALPGCKSFASKVLPPPTYDDQCVASDATWLDWAEDTQDLSPAGAVPSDPTEAYKAALGEANRLGLRIVPKTETGYGQIDGFSTTLPDTILLAADWEQKTDAAKAEILWHELVHKRQWDRIGREGFLARYIVAAGRWSIEVPAYRESFRVQRLFGNAEHEVARSILNRSESLYSSYTLGGSMPECTKQTSITIWKLDQP